MICEELPLICAACAERHVVVVDRGGEIIVYADLMKELFDTVLRGVVESHVKKCAYEIGGALNKKVVKWGWVQVNEKMRYFCTVA
jgi:hypothetical protein